MKRVFLIHLLCPSPRTLLRMCLLPVLHLLPMFLNALRLSVPSPQLLSDDSSSQPPSNVPPSSVPLSASPLQSSLSSSTSTSSSSSSGVSAALVSPLRSPLHSSQSIQDSSQQSADPSLLSQSQSLFDSSEPPSAPFPVRSPPSSVITGTPTISDLQLVAEVPSQTPPTVSDKALAAMEIFEVSPVASPSLPQSPVRAFVSRVASKRKPARLDPVDGTPPLKFTTSLPVMLVAEKLVIGVLPALSLVCAGAVFSRVTWLERVGRPGEASSETSEFEEDDEMLSVDDEDVSSAAPFPSPVVASGVPVPASDVPASDVAPALDVPEVLVSVPDIPVGVPFSVVPASHVLPAPVSDVPSSVPVQDVQCHLRFHPLPRFQVLIVIKLILFFFLL
ncbi:uncharacterized protein [Montipora capricornis]|uniref:uncharacterized protein n=1 Tax=Montipora capricornis TaxID=246305 RepID=UPI0035F19C06